MQKAIKWNLSCLTWKTTVGLKHCLCSIFSKPPLWEQFSEQNTFLGQSSHMWGCASCYLSPCPFLWLSSQSVPLSRSPVSESFHFFLSYKICSQKKQLSFLNRKYNFRSGDCSISGTCKLLEKGWGEAKGRWIIFSPTPQGGVCSSACQGIPSHLPLHPYMEQKVFKGLALLHGHLVPQWRPIQNQIPPRMSFCRKTWEGSVGHTK